MTNTSLKHQQVREAGKQFENEIDSACEYYRLTGRAEIEKTPEPRTVVGRTGGRSSQMICVNAKKAQPDYKGTISGGKSVVFEAKHTDSDRIKYGAMSREQYDRLCSHEKLGAVTFVLVSFGGNAYARIPFSVWREMKATYGRQYITKAEARPYAVSTRCGYIDFLRTGLPGRP